VLRAVVLTQYRRVTDRRTDRIVVANTALAMRALPLRRAVIIFKNFRPEPLPLKTLLFHFGRSSMLKYKKPSYRWGTARRGRASWNLV